MAFLLSVSSRLAFWVFGQSSGYRHIIKYVIDKDFLSVARLSFFLTMPFEEDKFFFVVVVVFSFYGCTCDIWKFPG